MDLFEEPEDERPNNEEKDPDYSGVIIGLILLPVFFFFRHIGKTDLGLNVFVWLGVNMIVIRLRWKLRKHFWFWLVMILVLAFESPLVLVIQWPQKWVPGIALLPIGVAGFLIAIGAIRIMEKFLVNTPPSEEE